MAIIWDQGQLIVLVSCMNAPVLRKFKTSKSSKKKAFILTEGPLSFTWSSA